MHGGQLAEILAHSIPGLKVLFVSGHAEHEVVAWGLIPAGARFMQKPFTPAALTAKLAELGPGN
jgi:hypothetical protein